MRKNILSGLGFLIASLAMAFILAGDYLAEGIYPDSPPLPFLTTQDNRPLSEEEFKEAMFDFASETASSTSRRMADATVGAGKEMAGRLWSRVKEVTVGTAPDTVAEEEDAAARTEGEETTGTEDKVENDDRNVSENMPVEPENREKGGFGWWDVKVNLRDPESPEQVHLKKIIGLATMLAGSAGLLLGMLGWTRRENGRMCLCSSLVGLLVTGWVYFMIWVFT